MELSSLEKTVGCLAYAHLFVTDAMHRGLSRDWQLKSVCIPDCKKNKSNTDESIQRSEDYLL